MITGAIPPDIESERSTTSAVDFRGRFIESPSWTEMFEEERCSRERARTRPSAPLRFLINEQTAVKFRYIEYTQNEIFVIMKFQSLSNVCTVYR